MTNRVQDWHIDLAWNIGGIFGTGAAWYFYSIKYYVVGTLALAVAFGMFGYAITLRRRKTSQTEDQQKVNEVELLHAEFDSVLSRIREVDTYSLMQDNLTKHDAAIERFRRQLPTGAHGSFEAAVHDFETCRDNVPPAALEVMRSTATGESTYDADVTKLESSIRQLLAQAAVAMGSRGKVTR